MAAVYNTGSWVWVPDEDDIFAPAKVKESFQAGKAGKVERDGYPVNLSAVETKDLQRMDEQSLTQVENMVDLKELNEAAILHNLRIRFAKNQIYTNVGTILVAVNPFKLLPFYTSDVLDKYKNQGSRNLAPHVYGVADDAYKSMTGNMRNQSCIVSGESGAGKTEATKIFLQYIAEISGGSAGNQTTSISFEDASLQEQILKANPLMEAFGNAKTVRNNNSSRFGKWIEVSFNNATGAVVGGSIVQYLLEKSRLVAQAENERNYHIFYNLCAGAMMDSKFRDKFRIGDPEDYHYLNQSGVFEVEGISDEQDFENLLNSMETIGIDVDEQDDLIRTLVGILHLGNVEFKKGENNYEDGSAVANVDMLEVAASQFGVKPKRLEQALCYKMVKTGRDTVQKANNIEMATDARDVLAKEVYAKMFEWLIQRINKSLASKSEKTSSKSFIGVLDIFGFESFTNNSFEQLCINYCNEKLQFHFNQQIFQLEQKEYKAENIDVSHIEFADNQPCLDLFEKKGSGIFASLDEEMNVPKGSDKGFLTKVTKSNGEGNTAHLNFRGPGVKTNYERESFTVIHYAGPVMYNVNSFLEKNRDKLSDDVEDLIKGSSYKFVSALIGNSESKDARRGKSSSSLGSKFQRQLTDLMKVLNATEPHFVRCIKPNDDKVGGLFQSQMCLDQLRYAGLLEVCRIRQIGYPVRKDFNEFYRRYVALHPAAKDAKSLCSGLEGKGLLSNQEFQIGRSKIFLRNGPHNDLEASREIALRAQAVTIQRVGRGFIVRCQYLTYMATLDKLRVAIKKRDYKSLKDAYDATGDLPNQGQNLPVVHEAWDLLQQIEEEKRVQKLLETAVNMRDINALRSAVTAADEMKFKCDEYKDAKEMIKVLEEEKKAVEAVKDAVATRDLGALNAAIGKATKMGLKDNKDIKQGLILKDRLEEEERVIDRVEAAAESRNLDKLKQALNQATEMGIENSCVDNGHKVLDELVGGLDESEKKEIKASEDQKRKERDQKTAKAKEELVAAAQSNDLDAVAEAKSKILELGVTGKEIDGIVKQANMVENMGDHVDTLRACTNTLKTLAESQKGISLGDVKSLTSAIKDATSAGMTEDVKEFKDAVSLEQKCMEQIVVQKELQDALNSGDKAALKNALNHADDLDMNIGLLSKVRALLKDKDAEHRKSHRDEPRAKVEMDDDEFEKHRLDNVKMAQNERYNFKKYYKIRTDGDYVKNLYFNKRKVLESKLSYQKALIPKSIIELDKDHNKMALGIHKSLLGYCGEHLMSFPATLAQDILIKGLEQPAVVDEIYIQLCKHLTENPKPESVGRAWQLMCLAVGTFPPSSDFEYYLLNFLLEHANVGGLVGNYARYSLRRLDGMLIRGASGFVPNIDEILAYKERPPILATIELVDGTPLTEDLPITPDLNVEKVLEICTHFLSLEDDRAKMFGIFVQEAEDDEAGPGALSSYSAARQGDEPPPPPADGDDDEDPPRTPKPLRSKDYLGDVVVQMTRQKIKHTFVFKRKLFLAKSNGISKDPVYSRLMYLQAADEVISGNIPVTKEPDVVLLTAMSIACDSEKFPSTEADLLDADLMEYVPVPWRSKKSDSNWARATFAVKGKVAKKSMEDLQNSYVEMVQKFPFYGHCFFYVRKELDGADMICSVSYEGIHFLSLARVELQAYKFSEIHRWGGSSTQFWLLVFDKKSNQKAKVTLFTSQARDLSSLILDYAVLAADKK